MASSKEILDLLIKDIAAEIPMNKCFSSFHFESFIRGYDAYQQIWTPVVWEKYPCIIEVDNTHAKYAIAIVNNERVVIVFA